MGVIGLKGLFHFGISYAILSNPENGSAGFGEGGNVFGDKGLGGI